MKIKKFAKIIIPCVLILAFFASLGFAQTSKGVITGVVTDTSGAVVSNASVNVAATLGGETRNVPTSGAGVYLVQALSPGEYTVTVSATGFAPSRTEKVVVHPGVTTSINAVLKVKSSTTEVTVEATSAQELQTISGEISHEISNKEITELPINSLNPIDLALTQPGVVSQANRDSFTNGSGFSVNGTRPRANEFLIDGFDNNDSALQGQAFTATNSEAIGEVTIMTNSFAAEYGKGGGSVTNVTFKGGNNQIHGSAWDLLQNSALNANTFDNKIAGSPRAPMHDNTFGFSLGGPIKKDKLFVFGTYQWDRQGTNANGNTFRVPDAAGIAALKAYNTPNVNLLLAGLNGLQSAAPSALCSGNAATDATNANCMYLSNGAVVETNLVARTGVGQRSHDDQWNVRVDYLPTTKDTLTFRYLFDDTFLSPDFFTNGGAFNGYDTMQGGRSQNLGILHTHTFTPAVANEFRLSFGRINFGFLPTAQTIANTAAAGPYYTIGGMFSFGLNSADPQSRTHNTIQWQDALNWTKGKHTLKLGLDMSEIYEYDTIPFNGRGTLTFQAGGGYTALANFVDNYTGKSGSVSRVFGVSRVRPNALVQNYYVQDTWRVASNLTLNLGLRYEYAANPENNLAYPAIDPVTFATLGASSNPWPAKVKVQEDRNNFAPRVGLSYTPKFWKGLFGDEKTALRAGYGMFYDSFFNNILVNSGASSPNVLGQTFTGSSGRGYANATGKFATITNAYNPYATQTSVDSHMVAPITHQWNLDVERALPGNLVLTLAYVGTRGEKLFANRELNPEQFDYSTHLNPTYGFTRVRGNYADSNYHGFNAKLDRRFSNGLLIRAAYTYSKMIDDGSEVFVTSGYSSYPQVLNNRKADYGPSAYDRKHRLVLTYVYAIPSIPKADNAFAKVAGEALAHWQIAGTTSFQTGAPETVSDGFDANGDGIASDRPSLGNPKAPKNTWAYDGAQIGATPGVLYDGPSANNNITKVVTSADVHWIIPDGVNTLYGDVRRNSIYTNGTQDWNFSLARTFPIREGHQVLFRTEMANPFNHANLGIPTYNLQDPDLADNRITATGGRTIRFWLKYSF